MKVLKQPFFVLLASLAFGSVQAQQTFTNGQAASLVIGQPNFTTSTRTLTQNSTSGPSGCDVSPMGMLGVFQQSGQRASIWNNLPTTNGTAADVLVGQSSFTSNSGVTNASTVSSLNGGVFSANGRKVLLADSPRNRVLLWNTVPTTNGAAADVVLGQTDFVSSTAGTTASTMRNPRGAVVSPDGRLIVTDAQNNRVLIWNSVPKTNGVAADVVIGQTDFVSNTSGRSATQMNTPWGVDVSPDGKLLVVDERNNRVLVYNQIPTTNGAAADVVIGQPNFTAGGTAVTATGSNNPLGVDVYADGKLAIAEFGNDRVLIYNQIPTTNGAAADVVLGQANFTSSGPAITASRMDEPYRGAFDLNGRLFVAGRNMNRVMVFGNLPNTNADLSIDIQPNQTSFCAGNFVSYDFVVQNTGPDTSKNIGVIASLPYRIGNTSFTITTGNGTFNAASGFLTIPSLANGETCTLRIQSTVPAGLGGLSFDVQAAIVSSSAREVSFANNTDQVTLTVTGGLAPPTPTLSNDTAVCAPASVVLTASGSGTINWYDAPIGGNLVNTGTSFTLSNLTSSATYYVEAVGTCPSARDSIQLDVEPAPVATIVGTGSTFCLGDGTILQSNNTNNNQWAFNGTPIMGATNQTLAPTQSGFYTVNNTVCNTSSATVNITIVQPTVPTVSANGPLTFCDTDSVTLTANQTTNITWSNGATTPSIVVKTAGDYYVTYVDGNNCSANSDTSIVVVNTTPAAPVISSNNNVLASNVATGNQWLLNGNVIPGATGQFYTATQSGFYQSQVSSNGCTATSNSVSLTIVNVNTLETPMAQVFPNPSTGWVQVATNLEQHQVEVVDAIGQTVLSRQANNKTYQLDLSNLPEGLYIVRLTAEDQTAVLTEKLILKR